MGFAIALPRRIEAVREQVSGDDGGVPGAARIAAVCWILTQCSSRQDEKIEGRD
jgi:hypothetical protein